MGQSQSAVVRAEHMSNRNTQSRVGSHIDRAIAALQSQPSSNPWAGVPTTNMAGVDARGVKFNTVYDVRGEPNFIKNQAYKEIQAPQSLENPRAMDAMLDKADIKNLRGPRTISYV